MRGLPAVMIVGLGVAVGGCQGQGGARAQSPPSAAPAAETGRPLLPPTPPPVSEGAPPATEAPAPTDLPGEPTGFGPAEGAAVAVIGVAHDDVLQLRELPGADQAIVASIPPLADDVVARGKTRHLERSFWTAVKHDGTRGWVNLRFIGYIGDTTDETAAVVKALGERPVAGTMQELGRIVAEHLASDEPKSTLVVTVPPTVGDLGEVTYDVIGLGDDSVRGLRAHVFGFFEQGTFSLKSVEVTLLCGRGVTADRKCL